jgi:thioredoxin-dependent peroxiredoxin
MALIEVGAEAPDIQATTGSGGAFRLRDHQGSSRVMLVFYPKDFTAGCTTQLINVQRSLADMRRAGVEPFGVNPDDAESHGRFCDAYDLAFELLVDEHMAAANAYGAVTPEGGVLRSVVVVGKDGAVLFAREGAPTWQEVVEGIGTDDEGAPREG